jgi:tellurite resistance protein TerC/cation:H+ antiporter
MLIETLRQARRVVIAVIGGTVVLLGILMIFTPGPGWLFILLGLSILSAEFVWARRLLKRMRKTGQDIARTVFGESKKTAAQDRNN